MCSIDVQISSVVSMHITHDAGYSSSSTSDSSSSSSSSSSVVVMVINSVNIVLCNPLCAGFYMSCQLWQN